MGHFLNTMNPEAADYANEQRPLPVVGMFVHYYPRPGEVRRGRKRVAALVVHVDEDNRLLDLVIVHDANDFIDQQRVPERRGEDRGWVRMASAPDEELEGMQETIATMQKEMMALRKLMNGDRDVPHMGDAPRRPGRPRKIDPGEQQG